MGRHLTVLFVNLEDPVIASQLNNELYFAEEPFALYRH